MGRVKDLHPIRFSIHIEMLEQTPYFEEKIKGVQHASQETDAEKLEKREGARLLRMEALLANARLTKLLVELFEKDPSVTREGLEQAARESNLVVHPEETDRYMENLLETKKQVLSAIRSINKIAGKEKAGETLFSWISGGKKNNGAVYANTNYPLSITLFVQDPEDFNKIDSRSNIGGFYQHEQSIAGVRVGNILRFPFIAVKGLLPEDLEALRVKWHEEGHARNRQFKEAAEGARRRVVWGGSGEMDTADIENLKMLFSASPEKARGSEKWSAALSYAGEWAKDELLADIPTRDGDFKPKLRQLKTHGGIYDYFQKHMKIPPESALYDLLWKEYVGQLETSCAIAQKILLWWKAYGLTKRRTAFVWVLAQIPFSEWPKRLTDSLFEKEMRALMDLHASFDKTRREYKSYGFHFTDEDKNGWKLYVENIRTHQDGVLFPHIDEAKRYLERIVLEKIEGKISELSAREQEEGRQKLLTFEAREELANASREFAEEILRGGKMYGIFDSLWRTYKTACKSRGLKPDKDYFLTFMTRQGWISAETKESRDKYSRLCTVY